ncbi:Uncharacterised protein [Klebsiella pneumoniae]|nr:Uncharacterised protein [Klebsiella pneumoniae]
MVISATHYQYLLAQDFLPVYVYQDFYHQNY